MIRHSKCWLAQILHIQKLNKKFFLLSESAQQILSQIKQSWWILLVGSPNGQLLPGLNSHKCSWGSPGPASFSWTTQLTTLLLTHQLFWWWNVVGLVEATRFHCPTLRPHSNHHFCPHRFPNHDHMCNRLVSPFHYYWKLLVSIIISELSVSIPRGVPEHKVLRIPYLYHHIWTQSQERDPQV